MSQFTLTSSGEDFSDLRAEETNYRPQGPNNQRGSSVDAEIASRDATAKNMAQTAAAFAAMTEEDLKISNAYTKEQTRLLQAKIENDPRIKRALRRIELREKEKANKESREAKAEADRAAFWNRSKPGTAEYAEQQSRNSAAKTEQDQRAQALQDRVEEKVKPIRDAKLAKDAAEQQRQEDMKDPAKRMAAARLANAGQGTLNYAEMTGADGKKTTYMRPTKEGTEGYLATRGNKNLQDMVNKAQGAGGGLVKDRADNLQGADRDLANKFGNLLAAMPSPGMQQNITAPASQAGIDRVTNAMAAAAPKPATPNMVTPTFNPAQPATQPSLMAGTPARPDPNAAAAIASFNQTAGNITRGSSPAQNANIRNLQSGDNVPTMADVPGELARRTGSALGSAGQAVATSAPVAAVGNVLSGKTPLIGGAKPVAAKPAASGTLPSGRPMTASANPEPVVPQRPAAPRTVVQTAANKRNNPLMAN